MSMTMSDDNVIYYYFTYFVTTALNGISGTAETVLLKAVLLLLSY